MDWLWLDMRHSLLKPLREAVLLNPLRDSRKTQQGGTRVVGLCLVMDVGSNNQASVCMCMCVCACLQLMLDQQQCRIIMDGNSVMMNELLQVASNIEVPFAEVDAHNIVPVWCASDKREYGARTIRAKIHKQLPEFLREYPDMPRPADWAKQLPQPPTVDWEVREYYKIEQKIKIMLKNR